MRIGSYSSLIYSSKYNSQSAHSESEDAIYEKAATQTDDGTSSLRALEYLQRQKPKSVVDQSFSYADSLKASRTKAKETSLEKKKLQYNYKKISSQILRSKNSNSARKAAAAARREVQRLKRLKNSGEYDDEELAISIEHAKSMERIAKKKAAHLQQEEMIERGQKGALGGLEEKEKEASEKDQNQDELKSDEEIQAEEALQNQQSLYKKGTTPSDEYYYAYNSPADYASYEELDPDVYYPEEFTDLYEADLASTRGSLSYSSDIMESVEAQISDSSEMLEDMEESMEELLEEMGLDELSNTLIAPDPDMSEDDLKMLKLKHRTKEMKDIAKADGDYLKAIMDKYEKKGMAGSGITALSGSASPSAGSIIGSSSPSNPVTVTVPAAYGSDGAAVSFNAFA